MAKLLSYIEDAGCLKVNIDEFHNYNTLQNNELTCIPKVEMSPTEGFTDFALSDAVYSTDVFVAKYSSWLHVSGIRRSTSFLL